MTQFLALPGVYKVLFLYIEPVSTILPAFLVWFTPGADWFHHELIPSSDPASLPLDGRTTMAIWQLGNCYFLLSLLSSFVFRAVRDALPDNPSAQERILGASFFAMAVADATHIAASFIGLPATLKYSPGLWNATTHGNISFVVLLLSFRIAWFLGIGRQRYYFRQAGSKKSVKSL
ncbi:hypothetical protein BV25DRAFT_1821542 [Artomyces pyxidatus]|uniref:Uncharacterized protein n=1 Tax=Artomyces pyxidatus TaxID=48021 RepID=A0ACB8TCY2_9AGAM|nr:hypothetical protein BV25DRAFT_1821542 [Artomyces pyxidatus]